MINLFVDGENVFGICFFNSYYQLVFRTRITIMLH